MLTSAAEPNNKLTSDAPEYRVFPESAVPKTVVPAIFPPVTVPVNVAPERLAFVFNCELTKVIFAGVANKVDTSVEPEINVVAVKVVNELAPDAVIEFTEGELVKFIIGLFAVPPVVILVPG